MTQTRLPLDLVDSSLLIDFRDDGAVLDQAGTLSVLAAPSGLAAPSDVDGLIGSARTFAGAEGLAGTPAGTELALTEFGAILILKPDSPAGTLFAYGTEGDGWTYGVRLTTAATDLVNVVLFHTNGLVETTDTLQVGHRFGEWAIWGISRERSENGFRWSIYDYSQVLGMAEVATARETLDRPSASTLSIGYRETTIGTELDLDGVDIDAVQLFPRPLSHEEFQALVRHITVDFAKALATHKAHEPASVDGRGVWSQAAEAIVRRELLVEADALSGLMASIASLRDLLPDRAYGAALAAWETILRLFPGPYDSVDTRRERVTSTLARVDAYTPEELAERFYELLDSESVTVLEHSHSYTVTDWMDAPTFFIGHELTGNPLYGTAGALQLGVDNDTRLWPDECDWIRQQVSVRGADLATADYAGVSVGVRVIGHDGTENLSYGVVLEDRVSRLALFVGWLGDGANTDLVYRQWDGYSWGSYTTIASSVTSCLALQVEADGAGDYAVYCDTDLTTRTLRGTVSVAQTRVTHLYVAAMADDELGANTIDVGEYRSHFPDGPEPFYAQIYRDPAEAGNPDYEGAAATLRLIKPTHTDATVTQATSLLLDDADAGLGESPLG